MIPIAKTAHDAEVLVFQPPGLEAGLLLMVGYCCSEANARSAVVGRFAQVVHQKLVGFVDE